jgi:FHA domain/Domain of unknown function (DUF1707)
MALRAAPGRIRPSAAEREQAIDRLRAGHAEQRLSSSTFIERVDVAYEARSRGELASIVDDLPPSGLVARTLVAGGDAVARWAELCGSAWRHARLPSLVLPQTREAVFGRSRACDRVIAEPTVSRMHTLVRTDGRRWWVADLGSTNGTWLNGQPVLHEVELRPGDELALGEAAFRVARPLRTMGRRWNRPFAARPASTRSSSSIGGS